MASVSGVTISGISASLSAPARLAAQRRLCRVVRPGRSGTGHGARPGLWLMIALAFAVPLAGVLGA
jgi:hypothetical protein